MSLNARAHIQEESSNSTLESHWGYVDRILPCTSDAGSCEYLDAVYAMMDTSMIYTFILWAVIAFLVLMAVLLRTVRSNLRSSPPSSCNRLLAACDTFYRRVLLPESSTFLFGKVSRVQILVLLITALYLIVFSLVGIVYKTWITPVKSNPLLHNNRTGLGGFADRVGALAYALTPLTVLLSSRESLLSVLTGIAPSSFNFLHRWLGRIMLGQALLHTFGWVLIEGRLYQPQPKTWNSFASEPYIIWGFVALAFLIILCILSIRRVIHVTGYEFFRKAHYTLACLYFGACWAHWDALACWIIASLGLWVVDRGLRLLRVALLHVGYIDSGKPFGLYPAYASTECFDDEDGGVVRLDFLHNSDTFEAGQHYYLTFPACGILQSHPFTVATTPRSSSGPPKHTYIIRCRGGMTKRLKKLVLEQAATAKLSVFLCGPYGYPLLKERQASNILAVAGGTGVSLTLPVILEAVSNLRYIGTSIEFIWVIRRSANIEWMRKECEELKRRAATGPVDLRIQIFVTEKASRKPDDGEKTITDTEIRPVSESSSEGQCCDVKRAVFRNDTCFEHPILQKIVERFTEERAINSYSTRVIASGPASMGHDLRRAVASCNDTRKVMRGDMRYNISLDWDDRMG